MSSVWNRRLAAAGDSSASSTNGRSSGFRAVDVPTRSTGQLSELDFPALPSSAPPVPTASASGAWGRRPVHQPPPAILRIPLSTAPVVAPSRTSPPAPVAEPVLVVSNPDLAKLDLRDAFPVHTNVFELLVKPKTVFRYDVTVRRVHKYVKPNGTEAIHDPPFKKTNDRRKQAECCEILKAALSKLDVATILYGYDGAHVFYTPTDLADDVKRDLSRGVRLEREDVAEEIVAAYLKTEDDYFDVRLEPNASKFEWNTGDVFDETFDKMTPHDTSTNALLHIALAQNARERGFLLTAGGSEMYETRSDETSWVLNRDGIGASVQLGEGDGGGQAQLVVSYKQSFFFSRGKLSNMSKIVNFYDPDEMKKLIGLRVVPFYSRDSFAIDSITSRPMEEMTTENGDSILEMAANVAAREGKRRMEYDGRRYGVQFSVYSTTTKKMREFSFPVENVLILDNQKVPVEMKKAPLPPNPNDKWTNLARIAFSENGALTSNPIFEKFGISVRNEPIVAKGVRITTPLIEYGGKMTVASDAKSKAGWTAPMIASQRGGFAVQGSIREILVLFNTSAEPKRNRESGRARVESYVERLKTTCREYGMKVLNWSMEDLATTHPGLSASVALEKRMLVLKEAALRSFVLYLDDESLHTHETLKLMERLCEIQTQHACFNQAVRKAECYRQSQSCQYVAMKLNVKCRGLNHKVRYADGSISHLWGDDSNTLIISYDVCHASGAKNYKQGEACLEPSCVGFAFNGTKEPEMLIGDFSYQSTRKEKVDESILRARAARIIEMYATARNKIPDNIVILRDGVADNQYQMVIDCEFKAIKEGIHKFLASKGSQKRPSFAVIIATKRRAHRLFFKNASGSFENVAPFTAVDNTIVRQGAHEIIFSAHRPIDGTGNPICLNMLLNDGVFTANQQVVQFIGALCCSLQITNNITSLPAPIKVADKYANRGARLFVSYRKYLSDRNKTLPVTDCRKLDHRSLTEKLCYDTSAVLQSRRVT